MRNMRRGIGTDRASHGKTKVRYDSVKQKSSLNDIMTKEV